MQLCFSECTALMSESTLGQSWHRRDLFQDFLVKNEKCYVATVLHHDYIKTGHCLCKMAGIKCTTLHYVSHLISWSYYGLLAICLKPRAQGYGARYNIKTQWKGFLLKEVTILSYLIFPFSTPSPSDLHHRVGGGDWGVLFSGQPARPYD